MESSQLKLPRNPAEKANCFSKLFFLWIIPVYKKGCRKKPLEVDDLYEPLKSDRSESIGNHFEAKWNKRNSKSKRSSLLSVVLKTYWTDYALLSLYSFLNEIIFRLGQPYLLRFLLQFFRKERGINHQQAIMYAVGIVTLKALSTLMLSHEFYLAFHNGMKVRLAVCSLVYRKVLRVSQKALGGTSPGKVVNMMSSDARRIDSAPFSMNYLWVSPLFTLLVSLLIYYETGLIGLVGIAVILVIVPISIVSAKLFAKYRRQTALKSDERIRFMGEIISAVQVIKMYAWEKPFTKLIRRARNKELKILRKSYYIRTCQNLTALCLNRISLFVTILAIVRIDGPNEMKAARVFVISSYLSIATLLMSSRFASFLGECAELLVTFKRFQAFLDLDEKVSQFDEHENMIENPDVCISMRNVTARWTMPTEERATSKTSKKKKAQQNEHPTSIPMPTLNGLNIDFPKGKLTGIIGPTGSGKSSLLETLLRELPPESGSISINGSISYASQEPWIFAASVRQNILFGQEYDHNYYHAVVKTCALFRDFEQFENGDLTIVGERGASLSGGQKARINLARACYRDADIYLLDDPLSAVDAHVGAHIFDECIGPKSRLAKRKSTRILVTHQVHFLKEADWLVVLKDGQIDMQGTPADLFRKCDTLADLFGIMETPAERDVKLSTMQKLKALSRESVGVKDIDSVEEDDGDEGLQLEASSEGKVKGSVPLNYFKAGAHWSVLLILLFSILFVQFLASCTDYFVSVWVEQERFRGSPDKRAPPFILSTLDCIFIHFSLLVALIVFATARSIGYYAICTRISHNIHKIMFDGIVATSMRFFDLNPAGRIINRFSKDLGAIDDILPKTILDATQSVLSMLGFLMVIAIVNPIFLVPVSILITLFLLIRWIFLVTSKGLRRLEGIVKSPAFTHLLATFNGLSTIRAYNNEGILRREFDNLQDMHSACWYVNIGTLCLFGLSLEVICTAFLACVLFYYVLFDADARGAKVGLVVSQTISFTGLVPWALRLSAEVFSQMTSVERVLEYRDMEPEKQPKKPLIPPVDWPSKGCIEFRNVFYRYFAEAEPVLYDLCFVINPMEKIGIVGRTGAGKSSLIGSLFRLGNIEGEILIDGIDTANIGLNALRKEIAIIPQDPVLFSGTLRRNLDPFEEYSDAEIWSALDRVELKTNVSDGLGLQSTVLPHGSNYSVGQRQLLCLARAILRKNRILVLDEATANVDPITDLLIQQTIRDKFARCTVLTIAHRLHTIIDSDRVIVMDAAKAVEFDKPHKLLQNKNGIFYGMVKALGDQECDRLMEIALDEYQKKI